MNQRLKELALLFFKLGAIGFGGLVAQIAMMEDELTKRRQWLTRAMFLDILGATNLVPGPNAVEIALHVGYLRAGWLGFALAGICFVLPAAIISGGMAWAYVQFGTLPQVAVLLVGIQPAMIAIILTAVWKLGRTAIKTWRLGLLGGGVALAALLGLNEVIALLAGGLIGFAWLYGRQRAQRSNTPQSALLLLGYIGALPSPKGIMPFLAASGRNALNTPAPLWDLWWFFLKIGAVLFGNGYIFIAFLGEMVNSYHWISQAQLVDAVAVGQLTPGPLLSTATFIGYLVAGTPGAIVATIAIFLPSFLFAALLSPVIPRLRRSAASIAFIDAINVSSVAVLSVTAIQLLQTTLTSWQAWLIAGLAIAIHVRWNIHAGWLILGGMLAGWLMTYP